MNDLKEKILESLNDIAECDGNDCQINLQSESARQMIVDQLMPTINNHINKLIEDIATGGF